MFVETKYKMDKQVMEHIQCHIGGGGGVYMIGYSGGNINGLHQ